MLSFFLLVFGVVDLHALFSVNSGTIQVPAGTFQLHSSLQLPDGAHDLIILGVPGRSVLRAANDFRGRAMLVCRRCQRVEIRDLGFDGNRAALARPVPVAPSDKSFAEFYANNGLLLDSVREVLVDGCSFRAITNFAAIFLRSEKIRLLRLSVQDSGSLNAKGRNNTSGGVLLEEGTRDFEVADSSFRNIRGNGVWTHSMYGSPRNARGKIANNTFQRIGRDAIQVGHATEVRVLHNAGDQIGYPIEEVDVEGMGTPVGVDTAGDVDHSLYEGNRFTEIDGKCIDLDGFHDGAVRKNVCVNRGAPVDYPFGNFAISLNNANLDMRSERIAIEDNEISGTKFGGIFLIGRQHQVRRNRMTRLNLAHCNEDAAKFVCSPGGEPDFLRTGIYLAKGAERPAPAEENIIEDNVITGWKMREHCVAAGPGVSLKSNTVRRNTCKSQ